VGTGGSYAPTPGNPSTQTYLAPAIITDTARTASESRQWRRNTDRDISGYLNLHYDTKIFGKKAQFSAGGMFRHKTRSAFRDTYSLYPVADANSTQQIFTSIPASRFVFLPQYNAQGSSFSDAGVYTFYENVQGGYGQVKYYPTPKLDVIFGLRSESTLQHYEDSGNPALGGQSATITYVDYLPSINAKYALTDIQALRASFYQSIYRPTAYDLIPATDDLGDGASHVGNPRLQHTTINNYDLRYEAFPGLVDEFMVGAFYKELTNAIEDQYTPGNIIMPQNLDNAHNYGFELVAKKFFGNIGVSANYTYTDSRITSTKVLLVQPSSTTQQTVFQVQQVRPLQGQSQNVGNFSLLYKSAKNGIDAQLAASYTGERINAVSQYKDLDIWEKASTNLDFSAQKEFKKKYVVFIKINNILNTPYELFIKQDNSANYSGIMKYYYQESPNYTTVQYDKYYARYNIGFRFKL
jgi:TonB-dependent receptor